MMEKTEKITGTLPSEQEIWAALCSRHTEGIQRKLAAARVAVAGLGGLGSNVAVSLARAGVGHLHLVDFDCVDLTNLNRQQYGIRHLGMKKTEALRQVIREINPYLEVGTDCIRVTQDNLAQLFQLDSIVCEAFDAPENKAMLVNGLLEAHPDKYVVAASGMAGCGDSNRIHTRRVTGNFYLCGDETTDIHDGVGLMAPRVALCAAHQANMVLRLIVE